MTNNSVFNNENSPVYMLTNNGYVSPVIIAPAEYDASNNQRLFCLTTGNVSVGSGVSLLLQITNPSGSGRTVYLSRVAGGASNTITLTIASSGTITGGTTPAPVNAYLGSATTSVVTTKQNTGTLGGTPATFFTATAADIYVVEFNGSIIVPANQTLTVTAGTGSVTASLNLVWWET
ncbi:hypothetical protein DFQ01_101226 [Paenibacillus cellulosilyticus]|uniref:Uncharacterized protein n=1 Tax=Paenibacillus cellulosilyticus TaxID=375489 RepID=A0A2V2YZR1_9BACL|nr:hypothetical protein [Paenibacillus cellulosilyticus]PWW08503.1 hypothetical protein DFQ01_101226 [Paenibacillus cellulosilyticus]QKS48084.1 hypothetical protein HUB94_27760 [Paenibacillus cellulosilyticus]